MTETTTRITSDEAIRRKTGRGSKEWFHVLDEWGAAERPHREVARWLAEEHGSRAGGSHRLFARIPE